MRFGFAGFLIPKSVLLDPKWVAALPDVPDRMYHVEATDLTHLVSIEKARGSERELICRMLERVITDRLNDRKSELWRGEYWTLFFRLLAANDAVESDLVRAYRGLRFGVTLVNGVPHFAADIRTRYLGRTPLGKMSEMERDRLSAHLSQQTRPEERALFIRDNGSRKIPCRYCGETGKTVSEFSFEMNGRQISVYDYYRSLYPNVAIHPADAAVYVQDKRGGSTLAAPASRLLPVFTTESDAIRRCSISPQLSPAQRIKEIERFLALLDGLEYGNRCVVPRHQFLTGERKCFAPPSIEFGNGSIIQPFPAGETPSARDKQFEDGVLRFGAKKVNAVETLRPFHNEPLPDVVLLYPSSLDRAAREQFASVLSSQIRQLTGQSLRLTRQQAYAAGKGQREGSALLSEIEKLGLNSGSLLAIVVLWSGFGAAVHGAIKEAMSPRGHSQCVSEQKVREVATVQGSTRLRGLVRNIALAVLTEVGVTPWVLAGPLHHNVHLGIDLLHGRVGYHALYGYGGRIISSDFGTALHQGRMREQIKRPELRRRVEDVLRRVIASGQPLGSMIIHRDGRWWPSERDGLREAVEALKEVDILPPTFRYGVVEVRKNHLPVRLFTKYGNGPDRQLVNPLPGSYLIFDSDRAILATTGRPGSWEGERGRTATTLLLELVDVSGPIEIKEVVEDVYRLTHLNWNAPEIEIALPVTIRWTDRALRQTLRRESADSTRPRAILSEGVA
jgi:hypothetical protein